MKADLLLVKGRILTMTGGRAEALAAAGDRILAVGRGRDLAALRGPRTRVVDLRGRTALPGFCDCHVHLRSLGARLSRVSLESARTLREALGRVAVRARRVPRGRWITGGGFDKNRWGDAFPTRLDLDSVAPAHPVALSSRDGHSLWANSLALKRCGIGRETRAPAGGVIARDAAGQPIGILQEKATGLVYGSAAYPQGDGQEAELLAAVRSLLRQGVTAVHAMEDLETFRGLARLREAGRLALRVTLYCGVGVLDALTGAGVRSGFGDEWLRVGGVKLLVDGALGSQTAWMYQAYERSASNRGVPVLHGRELRDLVRRAAEGGLACAIHAIGDRANTEALDALQRAAEITVPLPHRIEHAQLLRPEDIPRFAGLGAVASMQPCHILGDVEPGERYWGARSRWAYPVRSLMRAGAHVVFGSDAPVEIWDPVAGMLAAVRRQSREGLPAGGWYRAEEGVTRRAALRAYTVGPAEATGEAGLKGALGPGRLADVVVLSADPMRAPAAELGMARPDLVFVAGRLRYRRTG